MVSRMSAPALVKNKQVRVYLNEEAQTLLNGLTEKQPDLSEAQLLSMITIASLRALKAHDYRMNLPLKFKVSDGLESADPTGRNVKPARP